MHDDATGKLDQGRIAALVAVPIVDVLESVDVDHEQGQAMLEPNGRSEMLRHLHLEVAVVPDPSQAVGDRQALRFLVQQDVLDTDAGLSRQRRDRLEIFVPERNVIGASVDGQDAEQLRLALQRNR